MRTSEIIAHQLATNPVILYMKGTPESPQCGFSAKAASLLTESGHAFAWVDVLAAPRIKQGLPEVSGFLTFPQLFVSGELIGGSDIIESMMQNGELQQLMTQARE